MEKGSLDSPIYSRLFIVCERRLTEDQFRDAFSKFGHIQDIHLPCDHNTGKPKGIVYIKFSKTSEAADALEEMNLKILADTSRPLKVMVATDRSMIATTDNQNDEKYKRLFINVPKTTNEDEIHENFSAYGHVVNITVLRDRDSGESKGFAYVIYRKFSEAARAFEECDKKYRAIFALPKGQVRRSENTFESNINNLATNSAPKTSLFALMNPSTDGFTQIRFMCCPRLTQQHVERLFDIVPGMVQCQYYIDLIRNFGKGTVSYSNPISAGYAVEKLNEFEYPPGMKIFVKPYKSKFDTNENNFSRVATVVSNLKNAIETSKYAPPDLAQLTAAIADASKLIKTATASVSERNIPENDDHSYCSVSLPPRQPLVNINSKVEKRCFLVCKPQPPPTQVLRDVFCRFGDLINVYTLPNKTIGYALYASAQAADNAIQTLHGADIWGIRMKVIEAEEKPDGYDDEPYRKKSRYNNSQ